MNNSRFSFGLSLLSVQVTKDDISHGISRDCRSCAIARALNRTLPNLGLNDHWVRLTPYAAFSDSPGLEIFKGFSAWEVGTIPPRDLPDGLIEWAMEFDDWAEFKEYVSVKSWRENTGKRADDYPIPIRPKPITFVFNFSKLQTIAEAGL